MTADQYLRRILTREAVDRGPHSPVRGCQALLLPILQQWAGGQLAGVAPSGSFAKGTANASGTDIDLFISLKSDTTDTLKKIYDSLFERMRYHQFSPRRQNVSIGVKVGGFDVDLVPAKRQDPFGGDHSLFRNRTGTWTKTNVATHIGLVSGSGRLDEIRILKLWRDQNGLDFPSFYLELTVIEALRTVYYGSLSANVWMVLQYLKDNFMTARVQDPTNTNNILSDELAQEAKVAIKRTAVSSLGAQNWEEIVI